MKGSVFFLRTSSPSKVTINRDPTHDRLRNEVGRVALQRDCAPGLARRIRVQWRILGLLALLSSVHLATAAPDPTPQQEPVSAQQKGSVIRVNSTNQSYDFFRPWNKQAPGGRRGLGVLIDGNKVLVTAELVTNSDYVELERPDGGAKMSATVQVIDYEANLALLNPADPNFLQGMAPLEVDPNARTGDKLSVLQLESNGTPVSTQALVTSVEVGRYALEDSGYLMLRLSCPLQFRENSFTLPITKENKLAAFLMRYDSRSQAVDAISGPVIEHFLKEAQHQPYRGFPRAGMEISPTRDPQLRRYLKLQDSDGGVYVNEIERAGPAEKAGIRPGDVLVAIGDKQVDPDGNYVHPFYGKLSITHLTTTEAYSGQTITVTVIRDGERKRLNMELFRKSPGDYVVDPYFTGQQPRYYILGGIVLQELSRPFLREWGTNWVHAAPQRLVYADRYQSELFTDKRKIVFVSQVLATQDTVGYEQLSYAVLTRLNGREIKSLDDVAEAVKQPVDGFHKLEFDQDPREIYLDAKQVEENAPQLQKMYALPALSQL